MTHRPTPRRDRIALLSRAALILSIAGLGACFLDWDRLDPSKGTATGGNGQGGSGQGGGQTGGQGGGQTVCSPGETAPCYSGPDGTEDVGLCVGGVTTCKDDGSGFGPCEGEVVPTDEICNTSGDDDCDGQANEVDAGCSCAPGELQACYEGPMGTEGVGICTGGQAMCEASGNSLTACIGQVLPMIEECITPDDDDCDGSANEGCPLWAMRFGGDNEDDEPWSVAIDGNDAILMAGQSVANIDFGGGTLAAAGGTDAWIAKLDSSGNHVWSYRWGDAQNSAARGVAVDAAGNVYVAGYFEGTLDVGLTTPLTSAGLTDAFVVKLDAAGTPQWAIQLGDAAGDFALDVAVDSAGNNVVVTGYFTGTIDVGNGAEAAFDAEDGFVVSLLGATGAISWGKIFGEAFDDQGRSLAVDAAGNIYIAGTFDEDISLGGTPITDVSSIDTFVGKMDASGNQLWLNRIGGSGGEYLYELALDPSDNVIVQGDFSTEVDFGAGAIATMAGDDVFVGKYDSGGTLLWGKAFGGPADQHYGGVTADSAGNVWFGVSHELSTDYGGGPVLSAGSDDFVWVKLDAMGNHLRTLRFGDSDDQDARSLAVDSQDNVVVAGECQDDVDFGFGELTGSSTYEDVCLAKLPP